MTQTPNANYIALDELLADDEPTDWLIEGIYPTAEAILVSGASHSGKTFLLLDQGLAVAYGRPWLGHYDVPRARPVLYAPSEGRRGIRKRLSSAIDYHYGPGTRAPFYVYRNRLNLTRAESVVNFYRTIVDTQAALVIVDVLRDATPGVAENSDEMGDAFGLLRDLAHETGATFLVAHHLGKDTTKGSRGHSSLKDKADQEVLVTASTVPSSDGGLLWTAVTMTNSKNRNEENWGRLALDLRKPEGHEAAVIVGTGAGASRTQGERNTDPAYLVAIDLATQGRTQGRTQGGYATVSDLVEATGNVRQTVDEKLKGLVQRGFVEIDDSKRPKRITLTEAGDRIRTQGPTQGPTQGTPNAGQGAAPYRGAAPALGTSEDLPTLSVLIGGKAT